MQTIYNNLTQPTIKIQQFISRWSSKWGCKSEIWRWALTHTKSNGIAEDIDIIRNFAEHLSSNTEKIMIKVSVSIICDVLHDLVPFV